MKTSSIRFNLQKENGKEKPYKLKTTIGYVDILYNEIGKASGGDKGQYEVNRTASVMLPMPLLIEACTVGLSQSGYQLSSTDTKKLLRAIAKAVPK